MSSNAIVKECASKVIPVQAIKELEENLQKKGLRGQYVSVYDRCATPRKIMENESGGLDASVYEEKAITWDHDAKTDTYRLMHIIKYFGPAEVTGRECIRVKLIPLTQLDQKSSVDVSRNLPYFIQQLMEISRSK